MLRIDYRIKNKKDLVISNRLFKEFLFSKFIIFL